MKLKLKIVLATFFLAMAVAAFFGCGELVPFLQPVPMMMRRPLVAAVVIIGFSLMFGRLFCETMCPLGILQTIFRFIVRPRSRVRRVCTRLPESAAQRIVRWLILVAFIALIAAGFTGLAVIIEPYSIFGRTLILAPTGIVLFVVVMILAAVGKGRIWCNWVCPVGTVFNFISRFGYCRHKIAEGCGDCRACMQAKSCAKPMSEGITRRETLNGVAVLAASRIVEKTVDGGFAPVTIPGIPNRVRSVLPPGAGNCDTFSRKCVACGLCIANCPEKCLRPSLSLKSFGQPELVFDRGYCSTSCTYECARVCPAEALVFDRRIPRGDVHMGLAKWNAKECLRTVDGEKCTACVKKCPVKAIHIDNGALVVDADACIGCGACEHVCPSRPLPAIVVDGYDYQRIVKPISENDLLAEMRACLIDGGFSCVVARAGVIVERVEGHGVKPLMELKAANKLRGAVVFDRVIGRAAAAICIAGGVKRVRALVMGAEAKSFLLMHGVEADAETDVKEILNRDHSGMCPLERAVRDSDDPEKMIEEIGKVMKK